MKTNTLKIVLLIAAILVAGFLAQAQDKKISQLPALPSVTGSEYIPVAISGTNYYLTPTQLKSWLNIIGYVPLSGTNGITAPLSYSTDVSGSYTIRSLIDKGYADSRYIQLTGTTSGHPLTGTIEFNNSSSLFNAAIWKNTSLGTQFYIALTDNKSIVSSSHGTWIQFNDGQLIQSAFNTLGGNGVLNLQPGASEISAYDNSGNSARTFFLPNTAYVQSNNTIYAGFGYEATTAGYVAANGGDYQVFHRLYNDARYAPISGAGYVPLAGTTSGNPLTNSIEFDNSTSGKDFVFWKNTSLGGNFYFGLTDNKVFTSATHGSYSQYNDGQIIQGAFNAIGGQGVLNLTTGGAEISCYGSGTSSRLFQLLGQTYVNSTNTNYAGFTYETTTAGYVATNGGDYTIFNRLYNDSRYAPLSGGAYLSSTLTNGNMYVGNGSNIGAAVTPSLNSSAGTFTMSNTGQFTFPNASNSTRGFLSSADWTAFNNKQGSLFGTGFLVMAGAAVSYTTSIPNSVLSNSTISGVALGSNLFNHTAAYGLSGSSYNGSSAISWTVDTTVLASKLYVTAKTGSFITNTVTTLSSLSSVGTVTTGIWNSGITPVVGTTTSAATITINTDSYTMYTITSLSTATTFTVPTGTPKAGQALIIRIKDNGTARTLTFSTGTNGFRFSSDAPAPTTTTLSKTIYLGFRWNEADSKWDNVSPYLDNF